MKQSTFKAIFKILLYSILMRLSNRNIFEITVSKFPNYYILRAYSLRNNLITTKIITL